MIDREESVSSLLRIPTLSSQQLNVVRRVYQQDTLNRVAEYQTPYLTLTQRCKKLFWRCGFGNCLQNAIPIVQWLPKYSIKKYLIGDIVAGATTAVLHIPQGMAYSFLAHCSPAVGLYMGFFPIFIYIILGSSPHVCLGTFAVALLMCGKVVLEYANIPGENVSPYAPEEVLSVLTFTVGVLLIIMWSLRLGAVSSLLSEPLVSGLTTGASFHVCASQLKDIFGIKLPKLPNNFKIIYNMIEISKRLPQSNWSAVIISFVCCVILTINNDILKSRLAKRCRVPVPAELIVIIVGTLISKYVDLKSKYGVHLVGDIPIGLPMPRLPPFELVDDVFFDAITLAMVTYTITLSMGLILASNEYEVDANQELLALGASDLFGCLFLCGPVCASMSRTYVQYAVGGYTLITSFVSALFVLMVLLWSGPFFEDLPRSVLAAIVVIALKGLYVQLWDLRKFWKLSKLDATVWIVTFLVTVLVHIDKGLVAGLLASVGTLFFRSQTPYICLLGRVLETDIYLDIKRYRAAHEIPGIKIFHYCGGLNFTTTNLFRSKLYRKIGYLRLMDPKKKREHNTLTLTTSFTRDPDFSRKVQCVIIDASALAYVDAPGIKSLVDVNHVLTSTGITVLLAGANAPVLEMIDRYNLLEKNRLQMLTFITVHDAVTYYNLSVVKKQRSPITTQNS